ncbi:MAG: sulfatase-like hydrolase/transferase [Halioglobus sp.]
MNGTIFLSLASFLFYSIVFYSGANTPISGASASELTSLLATAIVLSALFASIFGLCTQLPTRFIGVRKSFADRFTFVSGLLLSWAFCLVVVENWFYTLFGVGLKTDVSVWLKLFFVALSGVFAYQLTLLFGLISSRISSLVTAAIASIAMLATLLSILFMGSTLSVSKELKQNMAAGKLYNVLFLSSDGLNATDFSLYGNRPVTTPFLESIRDRAVIFENVFANGGNTTGSITALLTGVSPLATGVVYPPDILMGVSSVRHLPDILGRAGYFRTQWSVPHYASAVEQNMLGSFDFVNGEPIWSEIDFVFDFLGIFGMNRWFLNRVSRDFTGVTRDVLLIEELENPYDQVNDQSASESRVFLSDLDRLKGVVRDIEVAQETGKRLFSQVHFMDTHGPRFHTSISHYSSDVNQTEDFMQAFYQDSILQFDLFLSSIFSKLESLDQLDNTIVVVTSDHGQKSTMGTRIPLVLFLPPSFKPGRYSVNAQTLDIAPTILDALDIPIPHWMTGESLLAMDFDSNRKIYSVGSYNNVNTGLGRWVRAARVDSAKDAGNTYGVIQCDTYAETRIPIQKPSIRPAGRLGGATGCSNPTGDELDNMLKRIDDFAI